MRINIFNGGAILAISLWCGVSAWAAPEDITKVVRDAGILAPGYEVKATLTRDVATVTTFRNPQASDEDCKIDAVLIARKVIGLEPNVKSVDVYFCDTKDRQARLYFKVQIAASDISNYGSGKTTKQQLIDSLVLQPGSFAPEANPLGHFKQKSYSQIIEHSDVVAGPMKLERADLLAQIRELQAQKNSDKVAVQQASKKFVMIEDMARANQIDSLAQEVKLLAEQLKNLRR